MTWRRVFRLVPGWLIRTDWRPANALYLAVAARAYAEEEIASGRVPPGAPGPPLEEATR